MHSPRLLFLALLAAVPVAAQDAFPGLQKVLTAEEWKRAGLERLTPDQIGVIDAALIRHQAAERKRLLAIVENPVPTEPPPGANPAESAALRSRYWESFGLEKIRGDWREAPPMKARVTSWQGANRFALDTGQVWEGLEPIPFDLLGQEITIEARPLNNFALKVGDNALAVRVRRLR
ncbi:MAG: hypothetical protein HZC55_14655 [Verrucomicrobia bacterium]|jgi:hypothetical protein|nr:hypothetical protein [Verrucomicrobiota bacterium]